MKASRQITVVAVVGLTLLTACGKKDTKKSQPAPTSASVAAPAASSAASTDAAKPAAGKKIVLGFSQVGSESGWRAANTGSIKSSAEAAGIDLKFSDAQQKQEKQVEAIRGYIQQKVDVIAFSPVVAEGWDTVLKEAKDAKIPVILTDRAVDSKDTSLYKTFIGSDFVKEGQRAGQWAVDEFKDAKEVNVVELQGTTGSSPAIDRKKGFFDVANDPKFKLVASQTGEFTRAKGKEVMTAFLKAQPKIDLLYAHNDDMALGAIEAIEAAGKVPGKDIKIVSIDGVKDGMTALAAGKINHIVECNPLLGDKLMDAAKKAVAGEPLDPRVVTEDNEFTPEQAKAALPDRKY